MPKWTEAELEERLREVEAEGRRQRGPSPAERLLRAGPKSWAMFVDGLDPIDFQRVLYDWEFWARPKQLPPDWTDIDTWLLITGRGFGKNRAMAEAVRAAIEAGEARSILFISPDWKDARRYMVGGHKGAGGSGFLDVIPPWWSAVFKEGKAEIEVVAPGGRDAKIYIATAEQPEQRGGNFDLVWMDEPIKYRYLETILYNVEMALRDADADPRLLISTTPKPIPQIKEWIMSPGVHVTHGTTTENASNIASKTMRKLLRKYGGTRTGMQELEGKVLGDNESALFAMGTIEAYRVAEPPELDEVTIAIDPAVSKHRKSDQTGIVALGRGRKDRHLYVLEDGTDRMTPDEWGAKAVNLARKWSADYLTVERNKVGDLAKHTLTLEMREQARDGRLSKALPIREAYSMTDKGARAEPVAVIYDKGRAHHVGRLLGDLEAEITQWDPTKSKSPNRLDALAHGAYELLGLAEGIDEEVGDQWGGFEDLNEGFGMADGGGF